MAFKTENRTFVCSVCGTASEHTIITETDPPQGVPDIDLRPDEPHRRYMNYWVMKCPECGYCNATLDIPSDVERGYLSSEEYTGLGGITGVGEKAGEMIKKALICVKNHNYQEAVQSYLYAAWMLDDEELDEQAKACRKAAVAILDGHPAAFKNNPNFRLLMADLLRRSGDFDRVVREFEGTAFTSQLMTAIAFFEVNLASKGDSAAHRADEVPGVTAK